MAAAGRQHCKLRYTFDGQEHCVEIGDEPFVVGRAPGCELVFSDESVSRTHARIARKGDAWTIADLDSKNGVKINTYRAAQQRLRDGDRIDLGGVRLYVEIATASPAVEAKVVFDEADEGRRTQMIDVAKLDSVLGASSELLAPVDPMSGAPLDALSSDSRAGGESGGGLHLFSDAAEALISCESLDETLERILALVFDNLPAERGVICLYDEDRDATEPKVMRTRDGVPDQPIRISSGLANDVIKRRQSLLVNDMQLDERFGGGESVIMNRIQSAMCAPLYREGRVVGFLYVDRQSALDSFSTTDLQALSTLGLLSAVAVEQASLRDRLRHEQGIRQRLSRYSSPTVVDRIVAEVGAPTMAADEVEVTVLFADLTGFTALAEALPPGEVVRLLNQVFERLTEVIFEFEGTLDKFRGDGLMAFFGAPLAMPDHAQRAVEAALRMQERLAEFNEYAGAERPLAMRIGINSGPVVVGDIGSPERKDYTVIGDVVNTASRLESAVAQPGEVVVGGDTRSRLGPGFHCQALEPVQLKGKSLPVEPHRVLYIEHESSTG